MNLISVEKALELIKKNSEILDENEEVTIEKSLGRIGAQDVLAPLSLPPFRQSIMDGYALCLGKTLEYKIIGEIKTGDSSELSLQSGQAARIFTGAKIPDGANAVVMQEHVQVYGHKIQLEKNSDEGSNIRNIGEQIKKGAVSLLQGEKLNPSAIGILKSFGIEKIKVYKNPSMTIISTGNELVESGEKLQEGQIFESNSQVLVSALKQKGIDAVAVKKVKDHLIDTENAIETALQTSDIVLISGGISVGDYDFVSTALENLGVQKIFYKVAQKPGKPLYFGKKDSKYIFALPGNPASTLTCFYMYVSKLIDIISGKKQVGLPEIKFPTAENIENSSGRALFLKAKLQGNEVQVLNQQNSAMLMSFARADALVYLPADCTAVKKVDLVTTMLLPDHI